MIIDALTVASPSAARAGTADWPADPDVDCRLVARTAEQALAGGSGAGEATLLSLPADVSSGLPAPVASSVRGLFYDPELAGVPLPRATPVLQQAASSGLPLVVAAGVPGLSAPPELAATAEAFPQVRLIASNGGQLDVSGADVETAMAAVHQHENLFMLSGGLYREDVLVALATRPEGPRLLFGSFAPRYDQRLELFRVRAAGLPDALEQMVLGGLARRLFGIRPGDDPRGSRLSPDEPSRRSPGG